MFDKRRGPFRAAALPPLCPVLRPLLAEPLTEAASHRRDSPLDRLLAHLDAEAHQWTLAPGADDLRPYTWAGWSATPRATYLQDLGADLRAGYSSATRRTVRQSDGVEVAEGAEHARLAVRMMVASYRRGGAGLGLDPAAVTRLADAFVAAGMARAWAATEGGAPRAAVVVASDGRRAFYWIAGSEPGPAMTALAWTPCCTSWPRRAWRRSTGAGPTRRPSPSSSAALVPGWRRRRSCAG